jgi:hypothetical protein
LSAAGLSAAGRGETDVSKQQVGAADVGVVQFRTVVKRDNQAVVAVPPGRRDLRRDRVECDERHQPNQF